MLWASFYWFKNGISYTMNLVRFAPAHFRVPVSGFRNSGESETRLSESDGGQAQLECWNDGLRLIDPTPGRE